MNWFSTLAMASHSSMKSAFSFETLCFSYSFSISTSIVADALVEGQNIFLDQSQLFGLPPDLRRAAFHHRLQFVEEITFGG
jgi:hypothetical protein